MTEEAVTTPARSLSFENLPMASDRAAACRIIRGAGPIARDDHGAYVVTTLQDAEFVLKNPERAVPLCPLKVACRGKAAKSCSGSPLGRA